MTVGVVVELEMVDIQNEQRQGGWFAVVSRDCPAEFIKEVALVRETGEGIL